MKKEIRLSLYFTIFSVWHLIPYFTRSTSMGVNTGWTCGFLFLGMSYYRNNTQAEIDAYTASKTVLREEINSLNPHEKSSV